MQISLVIRDRYVPSFWTTNLEFAYIQSIFDWKNVIFPFFPLRISKFTHKKTAINKGRLYCILEQFYHISLSKELEMLKQHESFVYKNKLITHLLINRISTVSSFCRHVAGCNREYLYIFP